MLETFPVTCILLSACLYGWSNSAKCDPHPSHHLNSFSGHYVILGGWKGDLRALNYWGILTRVGTSHPSSYQVLYILYIIHYIYIIYIIYLCYKNIIYGICEIAWVAWVARVQKILTSVVWVACVHKILAWTKKNRVGQNFGVSQKTEWV